LIALSQGQIDFYDDPRLIEPVADSIAERLTNTSDRQRDQRGAARADSSAASPVINRIVAWSGRSRR
jgi:hypothetical protein